MKIICPKCRKIIINENINTQKDTCVCQNCNELFYLSELLEQDDIIDAEELLLCPPKGISVIRDLEKLIIRSSTISKDSLFFIIFISLFGGVSISGFLQVVNDKSIIGIIFICPFLAATLFILWKLLYSIFGKIEIIFSRNENVKIFYGIGNIGKNYHVEWDKLKRIYKLQSRNSENQWNKEIIIEGNKTISISLENINEIKSEFLIKILKNYKYKKLEEIIK
ncbi:hypothetical protein FACS189485_18710 [Spirochaetia bacterium]|nr:hypothetical protein FACS189485_18710 [Spirochaetia bacterium]